MRVVFVSPTFGTGGSERLTQSYALELRRRGHEVVVAFGLANSIGGPLADAGIMLAELSPRRLRPQTVPEWVRALRRLFGSFRPDVVHAQSVTASLATRLAAPRLPQLVTVHGISADDEALASAVLRLSAMRVMAVSTATAAGLRRYPWAPPVDLIGPGIDLAQLERDAAAEEVELPGAPAFCCVARQEDVKGQDVLIRAFPTVLESLPEATLTFLGSGRRLEANRELSESLGMNGSVSFVGMVPNAAPYLEAADAVVLPSRREGLPIVVLEALGLERPVIATDVGGTGTLVVDGSTGWLVAPEDPARLAEAMVECGRDRAEARARAHAGRSLVENRYDAASMFDQLESTLQRLAWRRTAVPPTKPTAYYRAVRLHQAGRISAARRRRGRADWRGVRIFGYHRIADDRDDFYAVPPATFRAQMEWLLDSGVAPVRLDHALSLLEEPVEGRYACVTFDDGYRDFLDHALPVLDELGVPGTVFVVTAFLDRMPSFDWYADPPAALAWTDLPRLLAGGLVDVQAHSRTHRRMPRLTDADLYAEVAGAKEELEQHLPYELTSFSYPAGLYGPREVQAVQSAGFRAGVTTRPGVNRGAEPLGELRRTMVRWRDDQAVFAAKLAGLLDRPSRAVSTLQAHRAR